MRRKYKYILILATIVNLIILFLGNYRCPWNQAFNISCAGCGATRMVISILKLDFYQAFRYNPLMFSIVVLFFIYCIYVLIARLFKFSYYKLNINALWGLLILVVLFTVVRNISYFDFLKPTVVS